MPISKLSNLLINDSLFSSFTSRPCNGNPHWNPPEKFQFVINDCDEAKIIMVALNFNSTPNPEEIGIGVVSVQDINEKRAEKRTKLYSQETGECVGEVDLLVSSMKAEKATNIKEVKTIKIESIYRLLPLFIYHVFLLVQDSIYQYQRWQPGIGWGMLTFNRSECI